jgi:hypothetical protein
MQYLWIRVLETHDGRKLTWARATPLSLMVSPAPLRYPTRSEGPLRTTGGDGKRVSDVEGNPCTGWWRNGQQASTEHWRVERIGCRNWCAESGRTRGVSRMRGLSSDESLRTLGRHCHPRRVDGETRAQWKEPNELQHSPIGVPDRVGSTVNRRSLLSSNGVNWPQRFR